MSGLIRDVRSTVGSTQLWLSQQWTQRVVQVSVYAAVVFFLLSNYSLIKMMEKTVKSVSGLKLGNDGTLVLHSVIFGLFMYVGTRFILDPMMLGKVVEGGDNGPSTVTLAAMAWTGDFVWDEIFSKKYHPELKRLNCPAGKALMVEINNNDGIPMDEVKQFSPPVVENIIETAQERGISCPSPTSSKE